MSSMDEVLQHASQSSAVVLPLGSVPRRAMLPRLPAASNATALFTTSLMRMSMDGKVPKHPEVRSTLIRFTSFDAVCS